MLFLPQTRLPAGQWTVAQSQKWGSQQIWRAGCNFIPSTAINQLEMWQAATFDPATIDREFGFMQEAGLSVARIFLHDLAYEADPTGFKSRMQRVLHLAAAHGVKVMFVFFDDCWNPFPKIGPQPSPRPGVHNSGWVRSPSDHQRNWPTDLPRLKHYMQDVLRKFASDKRVWMWDLYNEPGNSGYDTKSLPLLNAAFEWAREVRPSQPLTAGAYGGGADEVDQACQRLSDVITFHCYEPVPELEKQIKFYEQSGRPVICSEWMARTNGSRILTHLPVFYSENIPCVQWGLVSGKTNTIFPWGSKEGSPEPNPWFHDLFRKDGTPFDPAEVKCYQHYTELADRRPVPARESVPERLPIVVNTQGITGLRLLADMPLRDPSVCLGPDKTWYLTGTVPPFYGENKGIKIWHSKDMIHWHPVAPDGGFVWQYGGSPWHKPYLDKKMSLWAPEIHFIDGTFWLTYSMPGYGGSGKTSGSGLLKSISGKAEGPYVDMCPTHRLGDEIDGSVFQDDDGKTYYVWHSGKIALLNHDRTDFVGKYFWVRTATSDPDPNHHSSLCEGIFGKGSFNHVGYEGGFLFKRNGIYYMACSENIDGRYSTMIAQSKSIFGPYSARYEAIPHGGHTVFFQDEHGGWWATIFGSDDTAPWQEKPGIVPIKFDKNGKVMLDDR